MANNVTPGPPGVKKLRIRNPKALTEAALLALANSESEEGPSQSSGSEWSGAEEQEGDLLEDLEPVEKQGLNVDVPGEGRPIDFFLLFADDKFFDLLVNETNAYAELVLLNDRNPRPQSRISRRNPVNKEMKFSIWGLSSYQGLEITGGKIDYIICHLEVLFIYIIMRCLHFSPNPKEGESRSTDRHYKVRTLVNFFNDKMLATYSPQKTLAIDESMLLWRRRLMFRQYIKNEKHKYGIKYNTGAADNIGGKGHAVNIVIHLANNYLDQGYSLYMDNFYNSVDFARQLLEINTYCTGTLRNGRKGNPSEVAKAKLKVEHENVLREVASRSGRTKQKPMPIAEYNKFMSGIDLQDQMMAYYSSNRKTIRWYKKVGIHIIEMMLYNSFMPYNIHSEHRMSYLDFQHSIIEEF
nr:unnamed protein product [Callosobruchus chinensis]